MPWPSQITVSAESDEGGRKALQVFRQPQWLEQGGWNDGAKWPGNALEHKEAEILEDIKRHEVLEFRVFNSAGECKGQASAEIEALGKVTRDSRIVECIALETDSPPLQEWLEKEGSTHSACTCAGATTTANVWQEVPCMKGILAIGS